MAQAGSSGQRRRGSSSGDEETITGAAAHRVILGLLRSRGGAVSIEEISDSTLVPRSVVREVLSRLGVGEGEPIPQDALVELVLRILEEGRAFEEVSRALSWQLFEVVAARLFMARGMRVVHSLRLRRLQIDILAYSERAVYVVECKRWLRGVSGSDARRIAPMLLRRCEALADTLERALGKGGHVVVLVPLILSVYGKPLVGEAFHSPLRLLRSFLNEYPLTLPSPPARRIGLSRGLGEDIPALLRWAGVRGR